MTTATDVTNLEPKEAARVFAEEHGNHFQWENLEDHRRHWLREELINGYNMALLLTRSVINGRRMNEEDGDEPKKTLEEDLIWTLEFNKELYLIAKEHNDKLLEEEVNESV